VLARLEEPQCSATALPIYRLYQACRAAGLTVILTGEGADELLGGYHWFRGDAQAQRLLWLPGPARALLAASPLSISPAARRVLRSGERSLVRRYALWHGPAQDGLLGPLLAAASDPVAAWPAAFNGPFARAGTFRHFQYVETQTRLVDFINFEVDRMSMAHSIEARVPFLDHELWEFAARLPARLLLAGQPKDLLRAAMRPMLPAGILARRKQGLAAPYSAWLRRARLPEWAEEALSPAALARTGYFESSAVNHLRAAHVSGRQDHARQLMGVLSTQLWHALFLEKPLSPPR
jgi:asparagine synthase (glutamine-hydrolysing)